MSVQIELGKYYRTRDGRKAGPVRVAVNTDNGPWQADLSDGSNWCFDADGTLTNFRSGMPEDLIAEWSDGPVRTETVTKRRIVPGVYGRLCVAGPVAPGVASIRLGPPKHSEIDWHDMTAEELDSLAMVASQLAEALRDVD